MDFSGLIKSIDGAAESPSGLNEEERSALLTACERLKSKIENPREATLRFVFAVSEQSNLAFYT